MKTNIFAGKKILLGAELSVKQKNMEGAQNARSWVVRGLVLLIALVFVGRLVQLQLVDDKYLIWANDQSIYRKVVYPARGTILDRNGNTLMYNEVIYDLFVTPVKVDTAFDTAYFCTLMDIDKEDFAKRIKTAIDRNGKGKAGVFMNQLSPEQNARLQEELFMFNGFELVERSSRKYPKPIGGVVFGYISEVSPTMLANERYASYRQGDYAGITGLENVYEEQLRGTRGVEYMLRDVMNRPREPFKNGELDTPAVAGSTLQLYLDADLQELTEKLMQGMMGSAIAIDPKTGGILAFVSAPTFDPNELTGPDRNKNFAKLQVDPTTPMFNRAIQGSYPPGSTFKPITAMVGLDVGVITPSFAYPCGGGYYECGKRIGCTHSGGGHAANLRNAMANSCNAYFCDIFRLVADAKKFGGFRHGYMEWVDYMHKFGLGQKLGVDITGESPGFIADTGFYDRRNKGTHYGSCNMAATGMGQDALLLTPLQLANAMCIIANKGYYYTPHFVESIDGDKQAPALQPFLQKNEAVSHIPSEYFQAVIDGMEQVVTNGTGRVAQLPGIAVCGKTGTVENKAIIRGAVQKLDNHSVFVCFAPKDDPKIAIAVIVQNSGYGATWAGPVATLMMEQYLTGTIARQHLVDRLTNAKLIKPYIYYLDSVRRVKDRLNYLAKNASKLEMDSIKRVMDTMMVKSIMQQFGIRDEHYIREGETEIQTD